MHLIIPSTWELQFLTALYATKKVLKKIKNTNKISSEKIWKNYARPLWPFMKFYINLWQRFINEARPFVLWLPVVSHLYFHSGKLQMMSLLTVSGWLWPSLRMKIILPAKMRTSIGPSLQNDRLWVHHTNKRRRLVFLRHKKQKRLADFARIKKGVFPENGK